VPIEALSLQCYLCSPMTVRRSLVLMALTLLAVAPSMAQGCSMCKAVAEESGFDVNPGIILLIIVPYVLLFLLFRKRIKAFWKEFMMAKG
jgi:hypothetical protein